MDNYSLSDIATASGGGMNGGSWIWIFALLILFGLGGNGFNRGGDYGQYATAASQQEVLFNQHFNNLDNKMDRGFTNIGNGIADATFALNNAVTTEGRNIQRQISEATATTNATTVAQTQKILDAIAQNKIDSLQAQVSELKTQNMFCGIPRINPYGYSVVPNATCCACNSF